MIGLHGYEFTVKFENIPNESEELAVAAYCEPSDRYRRATIAVNENYWPNTNRSKRRKTIVHELIHCHTWRVDNYVSEVLKNSMGATAIPMLGLIERNNEEMVENLAVAISRLLPPFQFGPVDS